MRDREYLCTVKFTARVKAADRADAIERIRSEMLLSLNLHESLEADSLTITSQATDQVAELRRLEDKK